MFSELINPLHVGIALGPLAVYLMLLGMINLTSRPLVTNGARDTAALGVGVSGFMLMGPFELFLPQATVFHWQGLVWLLLLAFYVLGLTLVVLLLRPRLIVYNIPAERIRTLLADLVVELDTDARWAGECLVLPQLGVQLHIESSPTMRNVQLVSAGYQQSFEGWRRLEKAIAQVLKKTPGVRNPLGFSLIFCGLFMIGLITIWMVQDSATVAQSVHDMLWLSDDN